MKEKFTSTAIGYGFGAQRFLKSPNDDGGSPAGDPPTPGKPPAEPGAPKPSDPSQEPGKDKKPGEPGAPTDPKPTDDPSDVESLKAEIARYKKEKEDANAEAAKTRKQKQEEMRQKGEFENLLKERETELEKTTRERDELKTKFDTVEAKAKLWDAHEKTERDNLLKEIPKEDHAKVKNWTNEDIRFFIAKAKTGLSGQQSQGSENGGKPAPVKKGGVRGAIEDFYSNLR